MIAEYGNGNCDRYYAIIENMLDGFAHYKVLLDDEGQPVDFVFLEVNKAYEEMMGLRREEIIGKKVTEVLPDITHSSFDWIGSLGQIVLSERGARFEQYMEPIHKWLSVSAYSPKPGYFVTIFQDVTALRDTRRDLKKSEEKLKRIFHSSPDAIVVVDLEGRVVECNQRALDMAGVVGRDDFINMNILDRVKDEYHARIDEDKIAADENGYINDVQYEFVSFDGKDHTVEVSMGIMRSDENKAMGYVIIAKDITERKKMQLELMESEKRYRSFVHNLQGIAFQLDADFKPEFIHGTIKELTGYEEEEFLDGSIEWSELVYPEDIPAVRNRMKELAAEPGYNMTLEYRILHRSGEVKWIKEVIGNVTDRTSGSLTVQGIILDVTKRKLMEQKLRKTQKNLLDAQRIAHIGNWEWDLLNDKLYWSDEIFRIFGHIPKEFEPEVPFFFEHIHPEDRDMVQQAIEGALEGKPYFIENRFVTHDGKEGWIYNQGIVQFNEEGVPVLMHGTAQDITRYKTSEEELKKLADEYETIFNGTQDALFLIDVDKENQFALKRFNAVLEEATGLQTQEIRGKTLSQIFGSEKGRSFEENYEKCIKDKKAISYEEILTFRSGEKIWSTVLSPIISDGAVTKIVGSSRDITEIKQAEYLNKLLNETLEYDKLRTEFFANLSHELRTPLNVILGSIQLSDLLLKDTQFPNESYNVKKYINIMRQNCYRLLRLVNNLIDITRIDSGFYELNAHNLNIVPIVEDICQSVAEYAAQRKLTLIFDTDTEEEIVACDPDKIERIILNLLSNSIKFTEPGGRIFVNLYRREDKVIICVKDTGIGIPKDKLNIIFERFRQADQSLSRRREGSGIGLSLVKSLVDLHHGGIAVESEEGKGTLIRIEFPAARTEQIDDVSENYNAVSYISQNRIERISVEFSDIYG